MIIHKIRKISKRRTFSEKSYVYCVHMVIRYTILYIKYLYCFTFDNSQYSRGSRLYVIEYRIMESTYFL